MNKLTGLLAGGIAALALIGAATAAMSESGVTQAQIEAAQTSQQHEAIAQSYEEEAAVAERSAESHAKMAQIYRIAYAKTSRSSMATHCDKLEKAYRSAAGEYRMLAEEHHKMAAAAR